MKQHNPRFQEERINQVLREELSWQAPSELSNQLLALAQAQATPAPVNVTQQSLQPAPAGPSRWYTVLVTVLTVLALISSLFIASEWYSIIEAQFGLNAFWSTLWALPDMVFGWLYTQLPFTEVMVNALSSVQQQVHWLLVALVLWLALDGWTPGRPLRRQQTSSS